MTDKDLATKRGESIRELQINKSNAMLELSKMENELYQTPLYKQIVAQKELIKSYEQEEEEMKTDILEGMIANGLKSLEFTHQKVTVKNNPPSVKIIDENAIPQEYKEEKVVVSIDKKKIKDILQNGGTVDGAELTVGHSLIITPK